MDKKKPAPAVAPVPAVALAVAPAAAPSTAGDALKAFAKARGKVQATTGRPKARKPKAKTTAATKPAAAQVEAQPLRAAAPPIDIVDPEPISHKAEPIPGDLNEQEMTYIGYLLTGEHSSDKCMILAGYGGLSNRNRYLVASRIVQRYESRVGDARKILRAAGLGEIKIALTVLELMKSDSQTVRVRACELAAKCLGMTKEGAELPQGMTIIIKGRDQAVQVNAPGAPPRPTTSCGQAPGSTGLSAAKPICITR